MNGFTSPNTTQTPNDLFEKCMKNMGEAELKVTLAVIRKTLGWHKDKDAISWSQIHEMTGLSRSSIQDGIAKAVEHGYIEIAGKGKRGVNVFRLVVNSDQSTSPTSTSSPTLPVEPLTSSPTLPTKETDTKETKQNKESRKRSVFPIKFPSNVKAYTATHIEAYQKAHTDEMTALIKAWAGDMYSSATEFGLKVGRMYIEVHQELVRLKKPCAEYEALANYTKKKDAWKDTHFVTDMLLYVTEYTSSSVATTATGETYFEHARRQGRAMFFGEDE